MPSAVFFSRLTNAVQNGIWKTIIRLAGGIQDSTKVLIGPEIFSVGSFRLLHYLRITSLTDRQVLLSPDTVFAAKFDSLLVNWRKNIKIVGALYRTVSAPSRSGSSFQVCGYQYHTDSALSRSVTAQIYDSGNFQNKKMSVCSSRAVFGKYFLGNLTSMDGNHALSTNNSFISRDHRRFPCCIKASMNSDNRGQHTNSLIYGYFAYNIVQRWINFSPFFEIGSRYLHSSVPTFFSSGTARGLTNENSSSQDQELPENSAVSSEKTISAGKTLKLRSGSCYLPHPDKEETGGEDAHFICTNEQAIGVADGVGGWAEHGVDAGKYSRELMSNSVIAIQEEPKGSIDPARVLEKAHSSTTAEGSSTACIIVLTNEGLHAINLGDSGFMVVRDGSTVFRSPVQLHGFNFTYQLESGDDGDLPSSGQVFKIPVAPGDVIIAGTDGLFDNLYPNEITAAAVNAMRVGLEPRVAAQKIAALARRRAEDRNRQTPFSTAAQDAGFRYYGGKPDDITVVVSYITSSDNEEEQKSAH